MAATAQRQPLLQGHLRNFDPVRFPSAARCAEPLWAAALSTCMDGHCRLQGQHRALGCRIVPHWGGHVRRTCRDFRSQFWANSGHSSRHPLKLQFRAIQRNENYPLRAKIEVPRFSRPFCGSVGAKCASAHLMRSDTKIQINSTTRVVNSVANSDF